MAYTSSITHHYSYRSVFLAIFLHLVLCVAFFYCSAPSIALRMQRHAQHAPKTLSFVEASLTTLTPRTVKLSPKKPRPKSESSRLNYRFPAMNMRTIYPISKPKSVHNITHKVLSALKKEPSSKKVMHRVHTSVTAKIDKQALEQSLQQQLRQESNHLTPQTHRTPQQAQQINRYKKSLLKHIAHYWHVPPYVDPHLRCTLEINIAADGSVLRVKVVRRSGNRLLDQSASIAVIKASPLPVPRENDLLHLFRHIYLIVQPEKMPDKYV